jgi:hypothetical protein
VNPIENRENSLSFQQPLLAQRMAQYKPMKTKPIEIATALNAANDLT